MKHYMQLLSCNYFFYKAISSTRCLIQYWFGSGNEQEVEVRAHVNHKYKSKLYCCTHQSTMNVLKAEANVLLPKAAVEKVFDGKGGIMGAVSQGEFPHNRE